MSNTTTKERLRNRVGDRLQFAAGMQRDLVVRAALDGGELPVLDLKYEDAPTRVQHDEIGVACFGPGRDVGPVEVIVFQQRFQSLGKALLAGCV